MKIGLKREEVLKTIQKTQGVVERKGLQPILSNLLIETVRDGIEILATDLEIGIKDRCPARIIEEGGVAVPAKKIFEILREIPSEEVLIEKDENNWVRITSGLSEFRIMGLAKEEFPSLPEAGEAVLIVIDVAILKDMLRKTIYSAGESDTRYVLNGLLLLARPMELDPARTGIAITMVGTDGHRLAVISRNIEGELAKELKVIIPKKAAVEMRKLLTEEEGVISIGLDKNHVMFKKGDTILLTRVIEGNYPNYEQIIPTAHKRPLSFQREAFIGGLRRVSILSREKTNAVRFDLEKERVILSSNNPDIGEAREELAVDYKGEAVSIGFNARYLLDTLGAMDSEKVFVELHDPLSPCLITEEGDKDYKCIVMPMRL